MLGLGGTGFWATKKQVSLSITQIWRQIDLMYSTTGKLQLTPHKHAVIRQAFVNRHVQC